MQQLYTSLRLRALYRNLHSNGLFSFPVAFVRFKVSYLPTLSRVWFNNLNVQTIQKWLPFDFQFEGNAHLFAPFPVRSADDPRSNALHREPGWPGGDGHICWRYHFHTVARRRSTSTSAGHFPLFCIPSADAAGLNQSHKHKGALFHHPKNTHGADPQPALFFGRIAPGTLLILFNKSLALSPPGIDPELLWADDYRTILFSSSKNHYLLERGPSLFHSSE